MRCRPLSGVVGKHLVQGLGIEHAAAPGQEAIRVGLVQSRDYVRRQVSETLLEQTAQQQGGAAGLAAGLAATLNETDVWHLEVLLDREDRVGVFELQVLRQPQNPIDETPAHSGRRGDMRR